MRGKENSLNLQRISAIETPTDGSRPPLLLLEEDTGRSKEEYWGVGSREQGNCMRKKKGSQIGA